MTKNIFCLNIVLIFLDMTICHFHSSIAAKYVKGLSDGRMLAYTNWILAFLVALYTFIALVVAFVFESTWMSILFSSILIADASHAAWQIRKYKTKAIKFS